jgi:hypothetical protein
LKRLLVILVAVSLACGKRGDPRPPVPIIPQATSDLSVAQHATHIVVSWSYPSTTTAGRTMPEIRRIVVYRHIEELPASASTQINAPVEKTVPDAVAQFAAVPTLSPVQFSKLSQRLESIEGANLKDATVGARIVYTDSPEFRSRTTGRPLRITYGVVTETATARSQLSNLISIVPLDVAVAPTGVTAKAAADGVTVTWTAPTTAATSGKPIIIGYNIYRDADELGNPLNPTPVSGTSFTDAPPYGEHTYRITAVASAGPPRIESEPSAVATTNFKDLIPPPVPASITPLVETAKMRVIWEAVDAADLAGYKLYRAEGYGETTLKEAGKFPIIASPTMETSFVDPGVQQGISYRYEVTSIDKSGNESKPISTPWVLVPRTP